MLLPVIALASGGAGAVDAMARERRERGLEPIPLFSIIGNLTGDAAVRAGAVHKDTRSPLLVQDQPWELRLDNAYPNVIKVAPGEWRLYYGGFIGGKAFDKGQGSDRANAWHFANSSDGVRWTKPALGIFNLSNCRQCTAEAREAGTSNNVLMTGDGLGVYLDRREPDPRARFKAFGTGCFGPGGVEGCVAGTGLSADGLHFHSAEPRSWPKPQRYDCHQNLLRGPDGAFVLTTRDFTAETGRDIAITRGPTDGAFGPFPAPTRVESGTEAHQLYSQVTFPFRGVWLGLVAVFDTADPTTVGTVRTRLSWSPDGRRGWQWLGTDDFVPLGPAGSFDSHIIFAAHVPIIEDDGAIRVYYMGGNGPHNGARNTSLGLGLLRADGFGGVRALRRGGVLTLPVNVTGPVLTVTADIAGGGSVRAGAMGLPGLGAADAAAIEATVTNGAVRFRGGGSFGPHVGEQVELELQIVGASTIYTVGFSD